jgi:hypothetical protein
METNFPSSALISVLGLYTTKHSQLISLQRNLEMLPNLNDQNSVYKHINFRLASVPYWIMCTTLSELACSLGNWRIIQQAALSTVYTLCFICRHHDPLHKLIPLVDLVTHPTLARIWPRHLHPTPFSVTAETRKTDVREVRESCRLEVFHSPAFRLHFIFLFFFLPSFVLPILSTLALRSEECDYETRTQSS